MDNKSSDLLDELRRVLDYNSETGNFLWKVAVSRKIRAGLPAGTVDKKNRLCIRFKNKDYFAHRLAWLLNYGKWPERVVDHIDGNPLNNVISNLRDVSNTVNQQNQRKVQTSNQSGFLGVHWHKSNKTFQASIRINGKKKHLGTFSTAEEGHIAYLVAKRELHEGCTI